MLLLSDQPAHIWEWNAGHFLIDTPGEPIESRVYASWAVVNISTLCASNFLLKTGPRPSEACTLRFIALEIMLAKSENIGRALKSLIIGLWITFNVCPVCVHGQEGKKTPVLPVIR